MMLFRRAPLLPMILQDQISECGHACVAMIACFWGHHLDLAHVRKLSPSSLRGTNLREITQILMQLGLQTRALSVPLSELHLIRSPALLHWNMNHFVVLKEVTSTYVIVHDPALGVCQLTHAEVSQAFTGIVLEIERAATFKPITAHTTLTLWDWMKSIQNFNVWFVVLLVLSFLIELLNMSCPLFTQYVADQVIGTSNVQNLGVISLGFLIMILSLVFSERIRAHLVLYIKMHMTEQFSVNIMRHLFRLPLSFFEARHKGDLQSKVNAVSEIQRKVSIDFVTTILDGVMMLLQGSIMLMYSAGLTCLVLCVLILNVCVRFLSYRLLKDKMNTSIHQHAKAASLFLESLQTMLPIKAYLKESLRLNAWRTHFTDALNQDIAVERLQIRYQLANQLMTQVEYIAVVACGALMVMKGSLSMGMLFAFLGFRQQLVQKCASLIHQVFEYRLVALQLERLNDIVSHPPEIEETRPKYSLNAFRGEVILQDVSFSYHSAASPVLSNISIHVQAGEKIALVGPSGCGKTTLLKIMMGLLEPSSGKILIDGLALNDIGMKQYRANIASVMQEDMLFSGSLLDNITFFDEDVDINYVHYVSNIASIASFIQQLPMGYETRVGDMGSSLSGGQKQRILLARALYQKPKLLFLDEATSHLDVTNECHMNQALKSLNITQVIVAHREETIRMADRIVTLTAF